jgi:hypothetical protein
MSLNGKFITELSSQVIKVPCSHDLMLYQLRLEPVLTSHELVSVVVDSVGPL